MCAHSEQGRASLLSGSLRSGESILGCQRTPQGSGLRPRATGGPVQCHTASRRQVGRELARTDLAHGSGSKIRAAQQRLVLCRLMIDIMRSLHGAYAPPSEPFGSRLETFFIGMCVALGQFEEKPFSVAKIAAYMRVPRTTVIRRLERLQSWGLLNRQGRRYYVDEKALNSLLGIRSYKHIRAQLEKAAQQLTILDTLPD